jgi:hypothetical protein
MPKWAMILHPFVISKRNQVLHELKWMQGMKGSQQEEKIQWTEEKEGNIT